MRQTVVFVTHSVFESVYLSSRIVVMTQRPGRVFADIPIDAPYPRSEAFRTSPEYAALCRKVSEALVAAMAEECGMSAPASRARRSAGTLAPRNAAALCAAVRRACHRRSDLGPGGAHQRHPALCAAVARSGAAHADRRLADSVVVAADDACHHVSGAAAGFLRRGRTCDPVQPIAPGRAFVLSVCGDPAGDAGGGDCAAAADLSSAAGGGADLRLDRRVLSGAGEYHARA